jgi:hypothetical protein
MEHRPNKKPRTDKDGMPASAVMAAPPSAESVELPVKFFELAENWGDGMVWEDMDHMTRLRFLTPRVIETGRPSRPETSRFQRLPKAVLDPLSDTKEAEMVHASECAMTDVEAYFKSAKLDDEEDKNNRRSRKTMKETMTFLWMVMNVIARPRVMVFSHTRIDGRTS